MLAELVLAGVAVAADAEAAVVVPAARLEVGAAVVLVVVQELADREQGQLLLSGQQLAVLLQLVLQLGQLP